MRERNREVGGDTGRAPGEFIMEKTMEQLTRARLRERANSLIYTSVDDCRSSLSLYTIDDRPIVIHALSILDTMDGEVTRRKLLGAWLKRHTRRER